MKPSLDATVIVSTYNRAANLGRMLASLQAQQVPEGFEWEALIVDNNSKDDTRSVIEAWPATLAGRFQYVFEPRQGKSHALNRAIALANGDVLAFTDDDVTVDPGWLANLVASVRETGCGMAGGKIVPVWNTPKPDWLTLSGRYRLAAAIVELDLGDQFTEMPATANVFGANMAIPKAIFNELGLFRSDLGPKAGGLMGGEDGELCRRIRRHGAKIVYSPHAVVYHPVESYRTERRYFMRWYYQHGRALQREEGIPEGSPRYFGVPRYLFRMVVDRLLRWTFSVRTAPRFYHKLKFILALGHLVEAHRGGE